MKTRAKSSVRSKHIPQQGRMINRQVKKCEGYKNIKSTKRINKNKSARAKRLSEKYKSNHSVGRRKSSSFTIYSQDGRIFYDLYTKYNNNWKIESSCKASTGRSISKTPQTSSTHGLLKTTVPASTSKGNSSKKPSTATAKREASLNAAAKVDLLYSTNRTTIKKRISKKERVEKKILRELGITAISSVLPKGKRMASINAVALISAVTHDVIHRNSRKSTEHAKPLCRHSVDANPCVGEPTKELTIELSDDHDDAATVAMCMSPEIAPLLSDSPKKVNSQMEVCINPPKVIPSRSPRKLRKKINKENSDPVSTRGHMVNSSVESIRTEHVPIGPSACSIQQITHQVVHFAVPEYLTSSQSVKPNMPVSSSVQQALPSNNFSNVISPMPGIPDTHFPYYTTTQYDNFNLIQPAPFVPRFLPINYMTNWQSPSISPAMAYNFPGSSTQPTLNIYPPSFNYIYQTPLIIGNLPPPNTMMPPPIVIQSPSLRPVINPSGPRVFQQQNTSSLLPPATAIFQQPRDPSFNLNFGMASTLTSYLPGRFSNIPEVNPQVSPFFPLQLSCSSSMVNVSTELPNTSSIFHENASRPNNAHSLGNDTHSNFINPQCSTTHYDTACTNSTKESLSSDSLTNVSVTIASSTNQDHSSTEVMEYSGKQSATTHSNDSWLWEGEVFKKPVFFQLTSVSTSCNTNQFILTPEVLAIDGGVSHLDRQILFTKICNQSDTQPVICQCYKAIRHRRDGMVIHERDNVFVCSGPDRSKPPHVAKITALFADEKTGAKMMAVLWYYRPEHVLMGGHSGSTSNGSGSSGSSSPSGVGAQRGADNRSGESSATPLSNINRLYASLHCDVNPVECIEDRAYVLTGSAYARFMAQVAYRQSGSPNSQSRLVVPKMKRLSSLSNGPVVDDRNATTHDVISEENDCEESDRSSPQPDTVSAGSVFICQGVYDYKLRRVIRNPTNLQSTIWGQYIQSRAKPSTSASTNEVAALKSLTGKSCNQVPPSNGDAPHAHNSTGDKAGNSGLTPPRRGIPSADHNVSHLRGLVAESGRAISNVTGAPLVGVTTTHMFLSPPTLPTQSIPALSTVTSTTVDTSLPMFLMTTASPVTIMNNQNARNHQHNSVSEATRLPFTRPNEQGAIVPTCNHDQQQTNPVWPSLVLPNGASWNA